MGIEFLLVYSESKGRLFSIEFDDEKIVITPTKEKIEVGFSNNKKRITITIK